MPQYAPYGNAIYGITAYGSPPAAYVQTTMSVSPIPTSGSPSIGLYDSLFINWVLPGGNWSQMILVRSSFAVPSSPFGNDGVQLVNQTSAFNTSFTDTGLQTGRFYYYALYVYDTDVSEWLMAASAQGLCLTDYGFVKLFTSWTPDWYMEQDQLLVPAGPLARFFGLIGFEMNWVRSEIETLFTLNSPEYVSGAMLPYLGGNVGIGYEPALGMGLSRNLVSQAVELYKIKGTAAGVQGAAAAYSGYGCTLTQGPNLEIQLDDATADRSIGHWVAQNANTTISQVSSAAEAVTPQHAVYKPIQGNTGLSAGLLTTVGANGYLPVNNENMFLVSASGAPISISECNATNALNLGTPAVALNSYMLSTVQPVGWWRMNETVPGPVLNYGIAGQSAGVAGLSGTGTLIGQPGKVPIDTSYTFNGSGFVAVPQDEYYEFGAGQSFTFGAWFQTTDTTIRPTTMLIAKGDDFNGAGHPGYSISYNAGQMQAQMADSGIGYVNTLPAVGPFGLLADGKWHFAVAVADRVAQTLSLYIDGRFTGSQANITSVGSTAGSLPGITIAGRNQGVGQKFIGSVQEAFVAPGALTAAQVTALYNSMLTEYQQPTSAQYVLSGYFRPAAATLESFFAQLDWYSSNGSLISSTAGTPVTEIAGQWVRVSVVSSPPTGASYIGRTFKSANPSAGAGHLFDAVQLEINTQATPGPSSWTPPRDLQLNLFPYARNLVVNGQGTLSTTGFDTGLSGVSGVNTPSVITAVTTGPTPPSGPKWAANVSGGFSVTSFNQSGQWIWNIDTVLSSVFAMPVNPSQAYTAAVWVIFPTGYSLNNSAQVSISWYGTTYPSSYISTTTGGSVGGVTIGQAVGNWFQVVCLDAIAPANAKYAQIIVSGSTNGAGTVYVAGPTFGPGLNTTYFDGLFSPSPDYAFEGTPNLSPSSWYPNVLTRLDRLIEVMPNYTPIGSTFSIFTHANAWANAGLH